MTGPKSGAGRRRKGNTNELAAAHYRHRTEPCDACRAAVAEYRRQWRRGA